MATKVASLYAEVNAKTDGFMSGMASVKGTLTSTASGLQGLATKAAGVGAALVAVGAAAKVIYDLGSQGAQIMQTESAFSNLTTTLGAGSGVMDELKQATRGTVSEMDLMRSTSTLLMGTSGDLGKKLADNAPQLARIAQAAHDLNPTMGTTADMFDRLARGIKKAEPELLDEVGILLNLTQVYAEYAKAHGTTAAALNKTQKAEAMLGEVLRQGGTLIEQASTVNTEYSTSIEGMTASVEDAKNELKQRFAPIVATVADAVTASMKSITYSSQDVERAMREASSSVLYSSSSYEEYARAAQDAAKAMGSYSTDASGLARNNIILSRGNYDLARSFGIINDFSGELSGGLSRLDTVATQFGIGFSNAMGNAIQSTSTLRSSFSSASGSIISTEQQMQTWADRMAQGTEYTYASASAIEYANERIRGMTDYYGDLKAAEDERIQRAGLMAGLQGTLGQATTNYTNTLSQLQTQEVSLNEQIEIATKRYGENSTQVQQLNAALTQNKEAQAGALAALQGTTAQMIFQQGATGLSTQATLELARGMGVLSEADYVVATSIETMRTQMDLNKNGMIDAGKESDNFVAGLLSINKAVQNLQAKGLPITFENLTKELTNLGKTNAPKEMEAVGVAGNVAAEGSKAFGDAANDALDSIDNVATSSKDTGTGMNDVAKAAPGAASGVKSAGDAAAGAKKPMTDVANAASDLANSLQELPNRTSVSVTVGGVDAAITELERLSGAISAIDTDITIYARVVGGSSGGDPGQPQDPGQPFKKVPPLTGATTITENYYVYNPLAAAMLVQAKRSKTAERMELLMNG